MNNKKHQINYLDFELRIDRGKGRKYPISVIDSPAGAAGETMRFPFDKLILEKRLQSLQIALLRSDVELSLVKSPEEQEVQDFGRDLFDALICGEIRSLFDVSLSKATEEKKGLRIKLHIQSPKLAAIPWEFIFDERQGKYLNLSLKTPIVRYIELPQPVQPLIVKPPLRILGMIAAPNDLPAIDKEREKLRIDEAVKDLKKRGLVQLTWLPGQTWRDLQDAMQEGPWHIFHFIGHGGFDSQNDEGLICLADEDGKNHQLSASKLGILLADHDPLRLVLLNACEGAHGGSRDIFSSSASILVRRGIPAVIAMQYKITDGAAVEFARTFYKYLAKGLPIDASVGEARKSISLAINNTLEWGNPVLYMRSPDGILFSLGKKKKIKNEFREELPPPGAETSTDVAKVQEKPAEILQEPAQASKPSLEKAPPEIVKNEPENGPRPIFIRLSLFVVIGIIIALAAYLIFKPGAGKTVMTKSGNDDANAVTEDVKKMPADVQKVNNKGKNVYKNEAGFWEADFGNGFIMVYIPAGEFIMGSKDGNDDEKPQHKVHLDAYWIAKFEVTFEQYDKYCKETRKKKPADAGWGRGKRPVINVSWEDATAYCDWLNRDFYDLLNKKTRSNFTLPSEAQWEKAARGTDGRKYPWGNTFDKKNCNTKESKLDKTITAGNYPNGASTYGCFDMAGNVWEWCLDWYDSGYYNKSPRRNPVCLSGDSVRVLRGGSWFGDAFACRSTMRLGRIPAFCNRNLGFRLARSL